VLVDTESPDKKKREIAKNQEHQHKVPTSQNFATFPVVGYDTTPFGNFMTVPFSPEWQNY